MRRPNMQDDPTDIPERDPLAAAERDPLGAAVRGRVRNRSLLLDHGDAPLRRVALDLAEVGLSALDPLSGLLRSVRREGDRLVVGDREYEMSRYEQVVVLGAGKATAPLAQGVERLLGERLTRGVIAVPPGTTLPLARVEVLVSDHPLPTERSASAARAMLDLAASLGPRDLAICTFTGGSSSLVSLPPTGTSLEDKRELHRILLASGMSIVEINTVRKHVSDVKGGRLARAVAPAEIVNLTVSDVVGDPLDCITDLTVQDSSTVEDALGLLQQYGLVKELPASVRSHLFGPAAVSPDLSDVDIESVIVTRGRDAIDAIISSGRSLRFTAVSLGSSIEGEASTVGRVLATLAGQSAVLAEPFSRRSVLVACGGECTVTLTGSGHGELGLGGPSQEAAIGAALALASTDGVTALFLDTDGADGGGDVAGAIVDSSTAGRADHLGISLRKALTSHTSTRALAALGETVSTGRTGTNANDLVVIVVG